MSKTVITRFAPSPTGFLHIGGARTALFNWLYARANNGKMLLRIEDTDRKRSREAATDAIFDGLRWLGLDWDDKPVSQFSRAERHQQVAQELVKSGNAYYCYASPQELEALRETAREQSQPIVYEWRYRDQSEAPEGIDPVIRLKAPVEGQTIVDDVVQGKISFNNKELDDMVLLRSDGTPTYMLAVVVDDHDMGITHIIRGDDHLTNAARQILLYMAMGWDIPIMIHIPLIHGADGAKLSKRHGALGVDAYRAMGYLPHALRNYLVRLGWSHGNDEIISTQQMLEWFDTNGIGKGASRFDFSKLEHLNGHYIRNSDDLFLVEQLVQNAEFLEVSQILKSRLSHAQQDLLVRAMPLLKEKAKTLCDLAKGTKFLFNQRPLELDEKATKTLDENSLEILKRLIPSLQKLLEWNADQLSQTVRKFCDLEELKLGKVAQPIRCAIAGTPTAPGVFELMELLGKNETLARISDQLDK
ncbi:MAG: glutamate--tRNA ligase [Hyphomicrobiales bacterium]|nr:glutamate--tRNA ligase [Hyphomicrobiales bacterium]